MGKIDRKREKIISRITEMENELANSLKKKSSNSVEINLPLQQKRIKELKDKLKQL